MWILHSKESLRSDDNLLTHVTLTHKFVISSKILYGNTWQGGEMELRYLRDTYTQAQHETEITNRQETPPCVCAIWWVFMCVCVCMQRPAVNCKGSLPSLSTFIFETRFLSGPSMQWAPGTSLSQPYLCCYRCAGTYHHIQCSIFLLFEKFLHMLNMFWLNNVNCQTLQDILSNGQLAENTHPA